MWRFRFVAWVLAYSHKLHLWGISGSTMPLSYNSPLANGTLWSLLTWLKEAKNRMKVKVMVLDICYHMQNVNISLNFTMKYFVQTLIYWNTKQSRWIWKKDLSLGNCTQKCENREINCAKFYLQYIPTLVYHGRMIYKNLLVSVAFSWSKKLVRASSRFSRIVAFISSLPSPLFGIQSRCIVYPIWIFNIS